MWWVGCVGVGARGTLSCPPQSGNEASLHGMGPGGGRAMGMCWAGSVPQGLCNGSGLCWLRSQVRYCCNSHHPLNFIWSTPTEIQRLAWCNSKKCLASSFVKGLLAFVNQLGCVSFPARDSSFQRAERGGRTRETLTPGDQGIAESPCRSPPCVSAVPLQCREFSCEWRGVFYVFDSAEIKMPKLVSFLFIISSKNIERCEQSPLLACFRPSWPLKINFTGYPVVPRLLFK